MAKDLTLAEHLEGTAELWNAVYLRSLGWPPPAKRFPARRGDNAAPLKVISPRPLDLPPEFWERLAEVAREHIESEEAG